jgi:hypothetical protein
MLKTTSDGQNWSTGQSHLNRIISDSLFTSFHLDRPLAQNKPSDSSSSDVAKILRRFCLVDFAFIRDYKRCLVD